VFRMSIMRAVMASLIYLVQFLKLMESGTVVFVQKMFSKEFFVNF